MQALLPADSPFSMSVNLSVKQLQHSDIAADVSDALAESGLAPGSLTLEITETVMMTDTDLAVRGSPSSISSASGSPWTTS